MGPFQGKYTKQNTAPRTVHWY